MFKRWILLLLVIFVLSAAWSAFAFHGADRALKSFNAQSEECAAYILAQPENWSRENDRHYQVQCDWDSRLSARSLKLAHVETRSDQALQSLTGPVILLVLVLVSFVSRWLFIGRLRWTN